MQKLVHANRPPLVLNPPFASQNIYLKDYTVIAKGKAALTLLLSKKSIGNIRYYLSTIPT